MSDDNTSDHCPSCGKPTGTRRQCRHCSASTTGRITEKKLVLIAALLLVIGTFQFVLAAVYSEPEISKISTFTEADNFRYVRVIGKVTDVPRFYQDDYGTSGRMSFYVNDMTGELKVKSDSPLTAKLMKVGKIPGLGDIVDVRGTLYAGEEYRVLKMFSLDSLHIRPSNYEPLPIALISGKGPDDFPLGKKVSVTGVVSDILTFSFARIIDISDDAGNEVAVFIPNSIVSLTGTGSLDRISEGTRVTVKGAMEWYDSSNDAYDKWEVIPASTADVIIESGGLTTGPEGIEYLTIAIGDLLNNPNSYENANVRLENVTVADAGSYDEGYGDDPDTWVRFEVTDVSTTGTLEVYAESNAIRPLNLTTNELVNVQGGFTQTDNNWQIKVRANRFDAVELVRPEGGGD